jgi:hypothetical protein
MALVAIYQRPSTSKAAAHKTYGICSAASRSSGSTKSGAGRPRGCRSTDVCTVTAGSSITARGMISGWRNNSLTRCRSSVIPGYTLNSTADNVVGTVTCGTEGGFMSGGGPSARLAP